MIKKTILFAINDLEFGGGQLAVINEANGLWARGYGVFVLTFRQTKPSRSLEALLKIPPENKIFIPARSLLDISAFIKLLKFLRKIKPDFVFSNLFFSNFLVRLTKIFYPRAKIIIREGNMPSEKSAAVKFADFLFAFLTYKIIVNAEAIKKSFSKFLPAKKITVIYNGVDETFFNCQSRSSREQKIIINVASLHPKKGQAHLLDAVKILAEKRNDFKLFLAGEGFLRRKLEEFVKENKLENFVEFLGGLGREDLKHWLCQADIFALSSLWEGLPNAMLEAMASGLPVVATDIGGVPEAIENNQNGVLVPAGDSDALAGGLSGLLDDAALRRRLGENAKITAKNFSWANHLDKLEALMKST